jgi:signal transduction histidine kinase
LPGVPRAERLIDRVRRLPPLAVDAAIAAVVGLVTVVSVLVEDSNDRGEQLTIAGVALLAVQVVPLVWRRRAPLAVMLVVVAAGVAYGIAELPDPAIMFAPVLAVYTLAAAGPRSITLPWGLAGVAVGAVALLVSRDADAADVAVNYFVFLTAWVVGDTVRGERERVALVDAQREEEARRAVADERVRIARDLHDVVAHHLSVIVVQAEAAQEVLASRPDRAGEAMGAVADTARSALGELRRVLGVLRSEGGGRAPQPDLDAVDDLVASVRQAGLAVAVRTEGEPRAVGGVVGVAAYRVVQEALTNVLRHAAADRAEVALAYGDDALVVTVSDDGRGGRAAAHRPDRPDRPAGHGLAGMRERVTVLGGSLDAGPRAEGGFAVQARLPLAPTP